MTANDPEHPLSYLVARVTKTLYAINCPGPDWSFLWDQVHFGKLTRDAGPQRRTAAITRADGGPLALRVLSVHPRAIDFAEPFHASASLREIEPGEHYELTVTIEPPWPDTGYVGIVRLETGVPEQPTVDIKFMATFPPRITWEAAGQPVPSVRSAPYDVTWRCTWSPEAPPGRLTTVRSEKAEIGASIEERDGQQIVIARISPELPAPEDATFYKVRVFTDDASAPEQMLLIRARPRERQ